MADPNNVKSIFLAASEKPAAERAAFLNDAVAGDTVLRARVEALLKAHDNPDSFLKEAAAEFGATIDLSPAEHPLAEQPGTLIGPYKLLEQIGEGGMGVVYMANQQAPVRRRVALKIIKAGMDTRQVIARFEAERQALALMDHSNIARVLDAGATDSGRPYFVMELVRGIPITEYCDQNTLPVHERLELFVQVCSAVQHAHQKGIIHRDLKPSNVLVTLNDGRAVPKVIDFGVAKATGQQLTEKTLFTAFAQMVGTPLYMSPEQAEMTSIDIDTRSDIYSLGVLLYELLTGTTPFDQARMRSAAFDEIRRIIREEEPPTPSTRISTLGETRTATAAHRQVDAHRLGRLLKGDLDWIVMKCLEKDRTRRYETATGLAEDIHRYLADQPVKAGRPTRIYRLKKFVRRNKLAMTSAGVVAAALVAVVVILALTNAHIRRESAAKDEALAMASRAVDQMLVRVANKKLASVPLAHPLRQALLQDALSFYEELLSRPEANASLQAAAADVFLDAVVIQRDLGRNNDALRSNEKAIDALQKLATANPDTPAYLERLAYAEQSMADTFYIIMPGPESTEDDTHYRRAQEIFADLEKRWPERSQPVIRCLRNMGFYANERADFAEAERLWREAIDKGELYLKKNSGDIDSRTQLCWVCADLGYLLAQISSTDRTPEAETTLQLGLRHADFLVQQEPRAVAARDINAFLKSRLSRIYISKGLPEKAIPLLDYAARTYEQLCEEVPQNRHYWISQRTFHQQLMDSFRQAQRSDEAKTAAHRMKDWLQRIKPQAVQEPALQIEFLHSYYQVILLLYDNASKDEIEELRALAQSQLDAIDKLLTGLEKAPDENRSARKQLAWMLTEIGDKSQAYPDLREPLLPRALALHSELANETPTDPSHFEQVGWLYVHLAWVEHRKGRLDEARQNFEKGATSFANLASDKDIPQRDGWYRNWEGDTLVRLSQVHEETGHRQEASAAARQSIERFNALINEYPTNLQYRQRLVSAQSLLLGQLRHGQPQEAVKECREQISFWEKLQRDRPQEDVKAQLVNTYLALAHSLMTSGQVDGAKQAAEKAFDLGQTEAQLFNQFAWNLVSTRDVEPAVAGLAVQAAMQATIAAPNEGNCWNTLGVAQYRAGVWDDAVRSLTKAEGLAPDKTFAFNGFFLAMAEEQLGHKEEARTWYDKSVEWMDKNQPKNEELIRFRAEAAEFLGISEPAKSTDAATQP